MNLLIPFIFCTYLIFCTVTDIKTKKINLKISLFYLLSGIVVYVFFIKCDIFILISNLLTGIFLMAVSALTRGAVGYGDGLIFIIMSFYFPFFCTLPILFLSLTAAFVFSLMLILKKYSRKYSIPFAPFILIGYIIFLLPHTFS